ncbi:glutaminyl-peptide cyclotransferase [Spongiibacter nanhainus]|uniref:Glutaminyl-peptide cyclotransferase n=1 Tax=Spongiibacter nanhainus TaxID=2794344 RepID=A0A7T4QYV4_9GAMM|nr:glutaminyl-peptide cyclotransferase [Spongiibacter nanhainus]QQD17194.1 glutaminyl-peptide cyclotransferase [Spongiibacter nanhainus]
MLHVVFVAMVALLPLSGFAQAATSPTLTQAPKLDYHVVARYPHNPAFFTQGLELYKGRLFETSGLYGRSRVLSYPFPPPESTPAFGLKGVALPERLFAEGLTLYRDRLYVLTWRAGLGLVLDAESFALLSRFRYAGEGWGLCYNSSLGEGGSMVMSNGTATLQWLAPDDLKVKRKIVVRDGGQPVDKLNELECLGDVILANRWQHNDIVIIHSRSGQVLARLDLSELVPEGLNPQAVLNGIAYDHDSDNWLVTGKLWPHIYRIQFQLPVTETPVAGVNAPTTTPSQGVL